MVLFGTLHGFFEFLVINCHLEGSLGDLRVFRSFLKTQLVVLVENKTVQFAYIAELTILVFQSFHRILCLVLSHRCRDFIALLEHSLDLVFLFCHLLEKG